LDLVAAFGYCTGAGECYYGQPSATLPEMLVLNQDILVASGDIITPIVSGLGFSTFTTPVGGTVAYKVTDFITTSLSALYDVGRLHGLPSYINIGFTAGGTYILYYQEP